MVYTLVMMMSFSTVARWAQLKPQVWFAVLAVLCLACTRIFYFGLNGNEEMYLLEARKLFAPEGSYGVLSSVLASSWANAATDMLLVAMDAAFGPYVTVILGRVVVNGLTLWGLWRIAQAAQFPPLALPLALVVFMALDQNYIAGEWIFGGFEAKIVAYISVLFAMPLIWAGRWAGAVLLLAVATYAHFQVGLYWTILLGMASLWHQPQQVRHLLGWGALYGVLVLPQLALLVYEQSHVVGAVLPNVDWIYGTFRHPHHTAPFENWETWQSRFAVGTPLLVLTLLGLLGWRWYKRQAFTPLEKLQVVTLLWLAVAFAATYATQESAVLGKFYLFRPNSVLLVLVLMQLAHGFLMLTEKRVGQSLQATIVFVAVVMLAVACVKSNMKISRWNTDHHQRGVLLRGWAQQHVPAGGAVLVGDGLSTALVRALEPAYPTYVMEQFIPTRPDEVSLWYTRVLARRALLAGDCTQAPEVQALALPDTATPPACTQPLESAMGVRFYKRTL
ncbi:MAG: hypothetical protein WAX89_04850 [Alphaproteobacteria bacterium]